MSTQEISYRNGDKYIGEIKNSKMHGKGIFIFANGGRYNGEFSNGKFNGYGKLIDQDGSIFEGNFLDGLINGIGKAELSNGDIYVGDWKNNLYHGKGKLIKKDKTIQEGIFHKGDFIKNHFLNKLTLILIFSFIIISGIWIYKDRIETRISDFRMQLIASFYGIAFVFSTFGLIFNLISIFKKFSPEQESIIIDEMLGIFFSPLVYLFKFLTILFTLIATGVAIWLMISGISYIFSAVIVIPSWVILVIYLLNRKQN
ncbi:hypothetical protein EHQ82_10960 [Leptospira selangorensis]|uniref:MORN repeat protein n=1 Tax=Leptospira selangorensis TaxID=2484982 RepID=A0ABY2NA11_9LEPT|nr:hypothetical protein [Leptospira selangorensis]TGM19058.1 hypothetical protein EHQ82_10960 [Leptospira selangorensis]